MNISIILAKISSLGTLFFVHFVILIFCRLNNIYGNKCVISEDDNYFPKYCVGRFIAL